MILYSDRLGDLVIEILILIFLLLFLDFWLLLCVSTFCLALVVVHYMYNPLYLLMIAQPKVIVVFLLLTLYSNYCCAYFRTLSLKNKYKKDSVSSQKIDIEYQLFIGFY